MKKALLLLMVSSLVGCMLPSKKMYMRSYVGSYYDCHAISLLPHSIYDNMVIVSVQDPIFIGDDGSKEQAYKNAYDALCEKHNDMTYNKTIKYHASNPPIREAKLGVDFVSIDIVSDADFDDEHSAGESLNDIILLKTHSAKPFIDNGYKGSGMTSIEKYVSELLPEDLVLIGGVSTYTPEGYVICRLFPSNPTLSKRHTFTVTMTADDGRVFSDTIEMTFE